MIDSHWPLHLPALGSNETLYSWCATFHRYASAANALATSRALFGNSYAAMRHDFPSHLGEFVRRTESVFGTPQDLALRHTLLGYFLPFVETQRADQILRGVTFGAFSSIKMHLGLPASGVGAYHPLRYCRECVIEDRSSRGWPIWHLEHQLPSVLVCIKHQRPLVQVWDRISPVHKREWLIPDAPNAAFLYEIKVPNDLALTALLDLAKLSAFVPNLEPGHWTQQKLSRAYRQWARTAGAVTRAGTLRYPILQNLLNARFNCFKDAFRTIAHAAIELDLVSIMGSATRGNPRRCHPLKHLVLLATIFSDAARIPQFIEEAQEDPPSDPLGAVGRFCAPASIPAFGRSAFLQLVAQGASIRTAASEVGVSTDTGVRWAIQQGITFAQRPKILTPSVQKQITRELRNGADRMTVATQSGVSLTTIHRLMSTDHALRDAWAQARFDQTRTRCRTSLLKAIANHPGVPTKALRRIPGSGWSWLYRHDRHWLADALPSMWSSPRIP